MRYSVSLWPTADFEQEHQSEGRPVVLHLLPVPDGNEGEILLLATPVFNSLGIARTILWSLWAFRRFAEDGHFHPKMRVESLCCCRAAFQIIAASLHL